MASRAGQPERFLATILFTDIAGSTDLAVRLGDRAWRRLLSEHNKGVRSRLREFHGRELDTAGDGFFCSFEQPAQAVRAADAILHDAAALGLNVRAGIHAGECERVGSKVGGIAVHIAARIMAAAEPSTVLVSSTVRDLIAGSKLEFAPAGAHALKGVPGEWALFSLTREPDQIADPGTVVGGLAPEASSRGRARWAVPLAVALIAVALVGVAAYAGGLLSAPAGHAALSVGINSLGTIDPATGNATAVREVPEGPGSVAIGNGRAWVGSVSRSVVSGISLAGSDPALAIGGAGRAAAMTFGDDRLWVADPYAQTVSIVNAGNGDILRTVSQPLRDIAYGFTSVWAVDDLHDVVIHMDRESGQVIATQDLPPGSLPTSIAVGADAVWIGNAGSRSVTRFDPATNSIVVEAIPLRMVPSQIAADGADVWVASREADALLRLDPASNSVSMTVENVCDQPSALLAVDSGVWLGCAGPRQLLHLDHDGTVLSTTQLGGEPSAITIDPDTKQIWVTVRAP